METNLYFSTGFQGREDVGEEKKVRGTKRMLIVFGVLYSQ